MTSIGPMELLVVKFPGNQFTGEVAPALQELVDSGLIRVVDLLFAITDPQGNITVLELSDLEGSAYGEFDPIVKDQTGLLTHEDARSLAARLGPDSSGAVLLFENVWATRFRDALVGAGGEVVVSERIPKAAVDAMVASIG